MRRFWDTIKSWFGYGVLTRSMSALDRHIRELEIERESARQAISVDQKVLLELTAKFEARSKKIQDKSIKSRK